MKLYKFILIFFAAATFVAPAIAQERSNTFWVSEFKGGGAKTVGDMMTAAQLACNPDTSIPCYIVNDSVLVKYPQGVFPVKCAQCVWIDYSSGNPFAADLSGILWNVKSPQFGAKCDGSTNDTAAFNAAIAKAQTSGGYVWVPPSTLGCRVNLTHSSSVYPLTVRGVPNASIIKPFSDGSAVITVDATANSVQPMTLSGLVIQAQSGFTNTKAILFKGGWTGAALAQSDYHHLEHLVIDGTTGFNFTSLIEVHGRMIWSVFRDVQAKYGYAGFVATQNGTGTGGANEFDGAFNKNIFDDVNILQIKGRGFAINYTRTTNGESIASENVFTHGDVESACLDTTVTDCAGIYAQNTRAFFVTKTHLEGNAILSADNKGANIRLTGTWAQGFEISGINNSVGCGASTTCTAFYIDATLAFGVIGGGNAYSMTAGGGGAVRTIYVATTHAQSDIKILDSSLNLVPSPTLVADGSGLTHVAFLTGTIASGTAALRTTAITSATCATVVTVSAPGVLTTDVIQYGPSADPSGVTGYAPSASGSLYIWAYPTANNVNFKQCNNTGGSITPGALTLNWSVQR